MSRDLRKPAAWCLALSLLIAPPAAAQFNNGSSGIHGTLPPSPLPAGTQYVIWDMSTGLLRYCSVYDTDARPATCTTELGTAQIPNIPPGGLTTGIYEFDHVNLANPFSFTYLYVYLIPGTYNSPLTILSQNEIRFTYVQLFADGIHGANTTTGLQPDGSLPGGRPGPGGFAGGASGFAGSVATDGNPGFGPAGGLPGVAGPQCSNTYGQNAQASTASTTLTQLVGGSGGGGGSSSTICGLGHNNGAPGGGGGGALLMSANSQIAFDGFDYLFLGGGNGGSSYCGCYEGGGGAGGSLKLVAPKLLGQGAAYLYGGASPRLGTQGTGGVIRVEGDSTQFNVSILGQSSGSIVATPGTITPAATPALRITQIGTQSVPAAPTGNTATPDVSFATPPTGPVTVNLAAANIPLAATIKVRVTPQVGAYTEVMTPNDVPPLIGTVASSTTTASVTIPPGYGSITATASFGCDGVICALLPAKDRAGAVVEVVASAGASRAFIVTKDGQRIALGN